MLPVRLSGDPFGGDAAAAAMRACLRRGRESGFDVALSLTMVRPAPVADGARKVVLTDGARELAVATALPPTELELIAAASDRTVASTAPVVVFAAPAERADTLALAGFEWPRACAVLAAGDERAEDVLARVRAALHRAGTEDPEHAVERAALAPWLALPPPGPSGPVLHVGGSDPAHGTDVAVRTFAARLCADGRRLRVVLPDAGAAFAALLGELAAAAAPPGVDGAGALEIVHAPLEPAHVADCAAVLQPLRRLREPAQLVLLLASARPVVATRCGPTAMLLGAPGVCVPVGGSWLPGENGAPPCCEPDPRSVVAGLRKLLLEPSFAVATGRRGRAHVLAEFATDRPAAPPPLPSPPALPPCGRARVVLEAPFFEVSSAAELSIATARALARRGNVELRLRAVRPFRGDLGALRARAPELVELLARDPGGADLWLSSGWPPRAQRPACRTFALRLDWEYGALPADLAPLVPQEADLVVVHSRHVHRTVAAAGRPAARTAIVPHGVDGAVFHEHAEPLAEVVRRKGDRPAVLFVGGLVFRKGFDLFLRGVLDAARAGHRLLVVVKPLGHDQHYQGFHLGELVRRFQATRGAPELLCIERELTRAELAGLYRAGDLLCHPYRGEGFGLPVLEARACGVPVLVTAGGATDDFASGPGVVRLPASRRPLDLPAPHLARPWVLEPDVRGVGAALAQSLRELPRLQAQARAAAAAVRSACSWDAAAAALERLADAAAGGRRATVGERYTAAL